MAISPINNQDPRDDPYTQTGVPVTPQSTPTSGVVAGAVSNSKETSEVDPDKARETTSKFNDLLKYGSAGKPVKGGHGEQAAGAKAKGGHGGGAKVADDDDDPNDPNSPNYVPPDLRTPQSTNAPVSPVTESKEAEFTPSATRKQILA